MPLTHSMGRDKRRKPLEFNEGDHYLLKVSPWKCVVRFGKKGKLAPRFVGPFEITERIGPVAYRLRLSQELNNVHDTFHVSNLKKCLADPTLHVPLEKIQVYAKLNFVEDPVEILKREIKKLKRSIIPIVKVKRMLLDVKLACLLVDLRSSFEDSFFEDCIIGVLLILCDVTQLVMAQVSYLLSEDVVALCFNAFNILYIVTLCYDDQSLRHTSSFRLSRGVTCFLSWGMSSYARAMIELRANVELKDTIVVFGHVLDECPKNIDSNVVKNMKKPSQVPRGVPVGPKVAFKSVKQVYRHVSKMNTINTSSNKNKDAKPTTEVNSSGSSFLNVEPSSTSSTPIVDKIDKKVGFGTNSLLEQWRDTYGDADYDYDPYGDDMYEGHEIPDKIQSICDNFIIEVRGCKKK
ncbi:hypothetical protein Tco_0388982 [Tanacetum coccineum]